MQTTRVKKIAQTEPGKTQTYMLLKGCQPKDKFDTDTSC